MPVTPKKNVVKLGDKYADEFAAARAPSKVVGIVEIEGTEYRVLDEMNAFLLAGVQAGDAGAFRTALVNCIHEDDRAAFTSFLEEFRSLKIDTLANIFSDLIGVAGDRPTK